MSKNEILVLVVVIFISVGLLSLFVNKLLKEKVERPKKDIKSGDVKDKEQEVEDRQPLADEVKEDIKEAKQQSEVPPISIALQDEFNEFKNYLKSRITTPTEMEVGSKSSEKQKKYKRDSFIFDDELDDLESFGYGRYKSKQNIEDTNYEELPNKVKALMFSDFFDPKF